MPSHELFEIELTSTVTPEQVLARLDELRLLVPTTPCMHVALRPSDEGARWNCSPAEFVSIIERVPADAGLFVVGLGARAGSTSQQPTHRAVRRHIDLRDVDIELTALLDVTERLHVSVSYGFGWHGVASLDLRGRADGMRQLPAEIVFETSSRDVWRDDTLLERLVLVNEFTSGATDLTFCVGAAAPVRVGRLVDGTSGAIAGLRLMAGGEGTIMRPDAVALAAMVGDMPALRRFHVDTMHVTAEPSGDPIVFRVPHTPSLLDVTSSGSAATAEFIDTEARGPDAMHPMASPVSNAHS